MFKYELRSSHPMGSSAIVSNSSRRCYLIVTVTFRCQFLACKASNSNSSKRRRPRVFSQSNAEVARRRPRVPMSDEEVVRRRRRVLSQSNAEVARSRPRVPMSDVDPRPFLVRRGDRQTQTSRPLSVKGEGRQTQTSRSNVRRLSLIHI